MKFVAFARNWLFSGGKVKKAAPKAGDEAEAVAVVATDSPSEPLPQPAPQTETAPQAQTAPSPTSEVSTRKSAPVARGGYSADEHTAWIKYLSAPRRAFRKPGLSVGDEYRLWQMARAQYLAMLAENEPPIEDSARQ